MSPAYNESRVCGRLRIVPLSLGPTCVTQKKPRGKKWPREVLGLEFRAVLFPSRFIYGCPRRCMQNRDYSFVVGLVDSIVAPTPPPHHPDGPSEVFWSKIKKIQKNLGCFAGAKTSRVYRQVFITFMANKTCKTFRFLKMY